jgi:hypothetical protein
MGWETSPVGDQAPIPIESRVTREPDATDAGNGAQGRGTSSGRVVHEPGRWPRLVAVVGIVGLVAGGLVWTLRDGDTAPAADEESANDPPVPPDDPQAETRMAFARAMLRWGGVDSFAYRGSVHVTGSRAVAPGPWTAGDVTIEGAVLLQHGLARDVAVDTRGRTVETVTSGSVVWTRSAAQVQALEGAPWDVALAPAGLPRSLPRDVTTGFPLDAVTTAQLVGSARNPRGEAPDAVGRRVIRATLPETVLGRNTPVLGDADVLLTLDDAGDIARLVATWPAVDPQLVLDLEISGHNQPQHIAPPDGGPVSLRRALPVDDLEAVGVRPLDLGLVPAGWRLTGAWLGPQGGPSDRCWLFNLGYGDPAVVSGRHLLLGVTSEPCRGWLGGLTGAQRQLRVGRFEGSVVESGSSRRGVVSDGTTAVLINTDLPLEDVVTLLASLRPFDPAAEPDPLPAPRP